MSDAYVECLVKAKTSLAARLLKYLLIVLAAVSGLYSILAVDFIGFLGMLLLAGGVYLLNLFIDVEYEYLYLDKELTVDKIMAKSRRKRLCTYTLERMEILAPVKSHHLDSYRSRKVKVKDYSVGRQLQPDLRYTMFYEGGEKVILSPSPELIKIMKNAAPRKVFSD